MEQKQILIAGTEFLIDTVNEQLVQKDNETNVIKFRAMEDMGKHYEFDYDSTFKNIHFPFDDSSGVIRVQVPRFDKQNIDQKVKPETSQKNNHPQSSKKGRRI